MSIIIVNLRDCPQPWDKVHGLYIGRQSLKHNLKQSPLANPFKLLPNQPKGFTLQAYRAHLEDEIHRNNPTVIRELQKIQIAHTLGIVNLICWCAPRPCHGEIIKEAVLDNWIGSEHGAILH